MQEFESLDALSKSMLPQNEFYAP